MYYVLCRMNANNRLEYEDFGLSDQVPAEILSGHGDQQEHSPTIPRLPIPCLLYLGRCGELHAV
jgi:hypothetical protein